MKLENNNSRVDTSQRLELQKQTLIGVYSKESKSTL